MIAQLVSIDRGADLEPLRELQVSCCGYCGNLKAQILGPWRHSRRIILWPLRLAVWTPFTCHRARRLRKLTAIIVVALSLGLRSCACFRCFSPDIVPKITVDLHSVRWCTLLWARVFERAGRCQRLRPCAPQFVLQRRLT
eukprot:2877206-Rhodomonas_salina.4